MGTTHALLVTDMSGSMAQLAPDVRGGFNNYVETLRGDGADYQLTVTVFDTRFISLCKAAPLDQVPALNQSNYQPAGNTALFDAIGQTITNFDAEHPTLPEDDRVILVVQTDGKENSSREFNLSTVKELLAVKKQAGWKVLYLGAGEEAWEQGTGLGLDSHEVLRTGHTARGTTSSYVAVAAATTAYAAGASSEQVSAAAAAQIDDDSDA